MITYFTEILLYYYKIYLLECKKEKSAIYILPQTFYYVQPLLLYFYSVSFTYKSFLFILLNTSLFYSFGKSGDLIYKNNIENRFSNEVVSYKIFKLFNHFAYHYIFYLKLFYLKDSSISEKCFITFLISLFQFGIYFHKSYQRRLQYIQELKTKENNELIIYPSYYKFFIITSNEKNIEEILKYTSYFSSQNYYFYIIGFIHFYLLFLT